MNEGYSKLCLRCEKKNQCKHKSEDIFSCIKKEPLNEQEKLVINFLKNVQLENEGEKLKDLQLLRSFVHSMIDIL